MLHLALAGLDTSHQAAGPDPTPGPDTRHQSSTTRDVANLPPEHGGAVAHSGGRTFAGLPSLRRREFPHALDIAPHFGE